MIDRLQSLFYKITGTYLFSEMRDRLYVNSLFISLLLAILALITNIKIGLNTTANYLLMIAIGVILILIVLARFYRKTLPHIFILTMLGLLSAIWIHNGGSAGPNNFVFLLASVIFIVFTPQGKHIYLLLVLLATLGALHTFEYFHPEEIVCYSTNNMRFWDISLNLTYTLIFIFLIVKSLLKNYEDERYKAEIQVTEIELQHKYMLDSINYARDIQMGFLQNDDHLKPMFKDYFVYWKPKDVVSGDFYVFRQNKQNPDQVIVAVSDCTGHGVPGAMLTMMGISFINEIIAHNPNIRPAEVLNQLRTKFNHALSQGRSPSENRDGMDMLICLIDKKNKVIEYAGSNRSLYVVANNKLTEYKGDRMPIGVHVNDQTPFATQIIPFGKEDVIYMTTDGFADQYGETSNKKFYVARFKRLLVEIHKNKLQEQRELLKQVKKGWQGDEDQTDDILVVGIKPWEE